MVAAIIGGDVRQLYLAYDLQSDGHEVRLYGFELKEEVRGSKILKSTLSDTVLNADCVLLPFPCENARGNINAPFSEKEITYAAFFDAFSNTNTPVLCGRITKRLQKAALDACVEVIDYEREELIIKNAIPSAEGALQVAMEEMQKTIHNSSALVTGFGRIGKLLARHLYALGAHVSVSARKQRDLAWISVLGYTPLETGMLKGKLSGFDVVFNTIPAVILTHDLLSELPEHCVIIDIASMPGGVDFAAARTLSKKVIHALSLPGKVAPITAGRAIRDVLYKIMNERKEIEGGKGTS